MYFSPSSQKSVTITPGRAFPRRRWAASMWAPELGPTKMPCSRASRRISVIASRARHADDVGDLGAVPLDDSGHEAVGDALDRVQRDLATADRARLARLEGDHPHVRVHGPKRLPDPDQRAAGADARTSASGGAGSCRGSRRRATRGSRSRSTRSRTGRGGSSRAARPGCGRGRAPRSRGSRRQQESAPCAREMATRSGLIPSGITTSMR